MSRRRGSTRLAFLEEELERGNAPVCRLEFLAPNLGERALRWHNRGSRTFSCRDETDDGTIAISDFDLVAFFYGAKVLGQVVLQLSDPHSLHGQTWPHSVCAVKAVSSSWSRLAISDPPRSAGRVARRREIRCRYWCRLDIEDRPSRQKIPRSQKPKPTSRHRNLLRTAILRTGLFRFRNQQVASSTLAVSFGKSRLPYPARTTPEPFAPLALRVLARAVCGES